MFKKKYLILIGLIVLIIGGVLMFNNFNSEKESQYKFEEDLMVKYIASNYADIEKVEFTEIEYNEMTGTYSFYATINNKIKINFTLRKSNGEIYVNELSSRNYGQFLEKLATPIEKIDISDIEVNYLEK